MQQFLNEETIVYKLLTKELVDNIFKRIKDSFPNNRHKLIAQLFGMTFKEFIDINYYYLVNVIGYRPLVLNCNNNLKDLRKAVYNRIRYLKPDLFNKERIYFKNGR